MLGLMELVIWAVLGGIIDVCGAPAVSLSFGGKTKNDSGVVFAYRNGSWVNLRGGKVHSFKSASPGRKEGRVNYSSELDDLFRRINLTLPRKMAADGVKPTRGTSEKPLGELFLEWLSKHETVKPVAAIKSTPIPVVGLQIDFDESPSARRDFTRVTSYPRVSPIELPFFLQQARKTGKSLIKRHQNPLRHQAVHQGDSDDLGLSMRKRQTEVDGEEAVKFIIEPITISPMQLMNSDLIELSSYFDDSQNMTKRQAIFSGPTKTAPDSQKLEQNPVLHLRRQRSFTETFTAPAKVSAPPHKMPVFDDALPVQSHVKKRHGKLFLNFKPQNEINSLTASPGAEESYSGQLMVRNEIPSDRKNKLNDLPKYVMKFLSQCKALIEQNYDEDSAKDNYDEDEALLSSNDGPNGKSGGFPKAATNPYFSGTRAEMKSTEIDEFESIRINKRPIKKKSKEDEGSIKIAIEDGMFDAASTRSSIKLNTGVQLKGDPNRLIPAYGNLDELAGHQTLLGDDLYDEDIDWHLSENLKPSEGKINRKMYYTSEANASTCRPIFEGYAPSTEIYTPECSSEPDVTTLSSEQWKVLMDMLNERAPTTCSTPSTQSTCATPTTQSTCGTDGSSKIPRMMKMTTRMTGSSGPKIALTNKQSGQAQCTKRTTTCATTTASTCATTTSTCATTTSTCATKTTPTTTCATSTEETSSCENDIDVTPYDMSDTASPKSVKQKYKPALPQRYLIKIETSKPKHYNELSHLQGRAKQNNWFDNIKNLKLLEGLRSNGQNFGKAGYNVLNPKSASLAFPNDPERAEKMIAEGVIPLKTGSTLNLYISYVLNKTKGNKGKTSLIGDVDDKLSVESMPHKQSGNSKIHGYKS